MFSGCIGSLTGLINLGKLSKFYRRHYELISKYDTELKHFCCKAYRNLNFMVHSTDRSKVVVPVLVLLFVAL